MPRKCLKNAICNWQIVSFVLILGCTLSGCGLFKANPAPDSGFLSQPELLDKDKRLPFHGWWVKTGKKKAGSGRLFIAQVDIGYLNKTSDWSKIKVISEEKIRQEAEELAAYFRLRLKEEFSKREDAKFTIVENESLSDGVLQIAIVELVPTDVVRNAAGAVAGSFVPGGGLISSGSSGSIAIEGRFIETKTGESAAKFKDREKGKFAPVDLAGLTAFRHARNAIDDWARQVVEMMESPPNSVVSDSSPFTLKPW